MGVVYKAWDSEGRSWVAVKCVRAQDEDDLRRIEREVRLLSSLRHEGVVRALEAGRFPGGVYVAMELLHGTTLAPFAGRGLPGPEEIRWFVAVAAKVLAVLEHVHGLGWIHGDVKPSNIFVELPSDLPPTPEAALRARDPPVKLLDFGLARHTDSLRKLASPPAGTPLYMAPEELEGALGVDGRADVYGVGAVLYHLVAARPPFATLRAAVARSPEPPDVRALNPACPAGLSSAIAAFLAREPHRRPPSAAEAREALLALLEPSRRAAAAAPRLLPPAFVGRREELEALRRRLRRAASGEGLTVQVVGEEGSGKTWFLERSGIRSEAALDLGMLQATGRCRAEGAVYGGLRRILLDAIEFLLERRGEGALPETLRSWGRRLAESGSLEPPEASEARVEPEGPEDAAARSRAFERRLLEGFLEVFREAARERPVLVVLEDAHAADDLEIGLAARIAGSMRGLPAAFVVTYSPEKVRKGGALDRWTAELGGPDGPAAIRLGGLTDGDVEELLGIMLRPPGAISARLAREVSREGKPRSVVRAIETLWDRGVVRFDRGGWDLSPAAARVSAAAGLAWTDRVRELEGTDASVVALAVLLSAPFDEEFAAKFLEGARGTRPRPTRGRPRRGEDGAARPSMARLRSLARSGFLVEDAAGFRKAEGLEPAALAGRFGPEEVRAFHERIAGILLERYGSVLEGHALAIAEHFRLAGNAARALELFLVEARYARGIFANRRSVDAYHKALELCEDPALKARIAEELGEVHVRVGEYPVALQCFALAQKLSEPEGAGAESGTHARDLELLDKVGRVLHRQGELGEALAIFSRAFERSAERTPERARALFRMGSIHLDRGDAATARRYLQESLDLYRELGDRRQVVAALCGLGLADKYEDRLDRAAAHFEEALRNAEASGCLPDIATALNNLANVLRALGDDARAIDCLRRSIDVRRHVGDRQGLAISLNNIARVHAFRGEIREAIAATETALSVFEEIGDRKGVLIARSNLGELAHVRSEFAKALEIFLENLSLAEKLRHERLWGTNLLAIAELELDRGNYEEALARAQRSLASAEDGPKELRARALGTVAAASAALGNLEAASDALRDAFEVASETEVREHAGVLAALRIRLSLERGDADEALASAREILARIEKTSDRYTEARVHREVGRLYRELGPDWADLTEKHLGAALRSFDAMGSRHQSALTRAELAVYWRLVGEEDEASRLFRSAEEELAALGLARRVAELKTMRDVS